ncbi:MAG: hypothetical protein JW889_15160 [Verrucomicrobia bacterium]|nr:hypothetical protein [Verrucomicrobiota bacterium]
MSVQRSKLLKVLVPLIAVIGAACIAAALLYRGHSQAYTPPPLAFDGTSDELKQTVIVPTLDTPMPAGKNVIWCASFQLAWNEMCDEIVGAPIRLANAEEIANRLNDAKLSKDILEPADHYIESGAVADGVIEQIQRDMASRFPDAPTPEIEASIEAVVAYAYLAANVRFTTPFFDNDQEFPFDGVPVRSFGIREKDTYAYGTLREQVEVLSLLPDDDDMYMDYERPSHANPFVIDLCTKSSPYQVIVACLEPKPTLGETLADLDGRIAEWQGEEWERDFGITDVLLVPTLSWRVKHRFTELEGTDKTILNEDSPVAGYWVCEASQLIDFKLDRSGASLRSEAKHLCKAGPRYFLLNRPFLIVMKKRGAEQPFFVMWVDNAELLCKP